MWGGKGQIWAACKGLLVKNTAQAVFGNDLGDVPQWFPMMQLHLVENFLSYMGSILFHRRISKVRCITMTYDM